VDSLGNRVREVRGSVSQAEFAKLFGLSQATISSIEAGRTEPNADFLCALVSHFQVDLNWLITGESSPLGVREPGSTYRVRENVQKLAEELAKRPKLAAAVSVLIRADDKLPQLAREMASALGISEEDAYLKLLEMKKEAT
jgi:transcriptional regulator with XRE-family HTH domain